MPSDVGSVYAQTLDQIDAQPKSQARLARKCLCWLVLARRSLTIQEFLDAIAIEPYTQDLDSLNRSSTATVVRVCRGLVVVDSNSFIVSLAHLTIQEYLGTHFMEEINSMKLEISSACLTYTLFEAFKDGPCKSMGDYRERLRKYPFYEYACCHLPAHIEDSGIDPSLTKSLRFLVTSKARSEAFLQVVFTGSRRMATHSIPELTTSLHIAAAIGSAEVVKLLIEENPLELEATDDCNKTPLLWAIERNRESVVKELLRHGAKVNGTSESALNCAARNRQDHLVRLLMQESMISTGSEKATKCELFVATITGDKLKLEEAISQGVEIDSVDADGGTALQWAAWYGHDKLIAVLIEAGSNVQASDKKGRGALHEAAERGHLKVAEILLRHGAVVNARDDSTLTPLHWAAISGECQMAKLLLKNGADVSITTMFGETALQCAIDHEKDEVVQLLAKEKIDTKGDE